MTKHRTTISLTPEARAGLESLFAALGWEGQRGAVLNAGLERLGLMAFDDWSAIVPVIEEAEYQADLRDAILSREASEMRRADE